MRNEDEDEDTLHITDCYGVTNVAGLGQCASLHTLQLTSHSGVANLDGLNCVVAVAGEVLIMRMKRQQG